jgi:hypothetical protein
MNHHVTRRTIVAAAAATTAAIMPDWREAVAAPATEHVDAELVRLSAEFQREYEKWVPLWLVSERTFGVWRETVDARGLTIKDNYDEVWSVFQEVGAESAGDASNAQLDVLNDLSECIRAIPPQTIAGLAAWARVIRFESIPAPVELCDPRGDWDWNHKCLADFFEQVERLAGPQTPLAKADEADSDDDLHQFQQPLGHWSQLADGDKREVLSLLKGGQAKLAA